MEELFSQMAKDPYFQRRHFLKVIDAYLYYLEEDKSDLD